MMQTENSRDLVTDVFRQVVGVFRSFFLFFLLRVYDGFLRYFFMITVMIKHPNEKRSKDNRNCFTTRTLR